MPGVCWFALPGRPSPSHLARAPRPVAFLPEPLAGGGQSMKQSFAIGIGGAAGQGVATPGDIFAKIFSRRGLHLNVYNAYQSIIRGGHTFLTIRTGPDKITNMGDRIHPLIPLNQDTMERNPSFLSSGGAVFLN